MSAHTELPQTQLPLLLRTCYLALHRRSDAVFAIHGVTADQFVLLATLSSGQALTQRELARRMPSDPSTVRAMLVLLERQGLVRRDAHPTDSRARTVALTPAGEQKFQDLWHAGEPVRRQLIDGLQPDEVQTLVRLLAKVAGSLNSSALATAPDAFQLSPARHP